MQSRIEVCDLQRVGWLRLTALQHDVYKRVNIGFYKAIGPSSEAAPPQPKWAETYLQA